MPVDFKYITYRGKEVDKEGRLVFDIPEGQVFILNQFSVYSAIFTKPMDKRLDYLEALRAKVSKFLENKQLIGTLVEDNEEFTFYFLGVVNFEGVLENFIDASPLFNFGVSLLNTNVTEEKVAHNLVAEPYTGIGMFIDEQK